MIINAAGNTQVVSKNKSEKTPKQINYEKYSRRIREISLDIPLEQQLSRSRRPQLHHRPALIRHTMCSARQDAEGVDVSTAEELALIALMQGYQGESFDDLVREILFDYCPEEGYDFFISDMEDRLEDYREQYSPDKYPPYSLWSTEAFKTELLGVIDDYFTTYLPTE